jgi:hypothetical protein
MGRKAYTEGNQVEIWKILLLGVDEIETMLERVYAQGTAMDALACGRVLDRDF